MQEASLGIPDWSLGFRGPSPLTCPNPISVSHLPMSLWGIKISGGAPSG